MRSTEYRERFDATGHLIISNVQYVGIATYNVITTAPTTAAIEAYETSLLVFSTGENAWLPILWTGSVSGNNNLMTDEDQDEDLTLAAMLTQTSSCSPAITGPLAEPVQSPATTYAPVTGHCSVISWTNNGDGTLTITFSESVTPNTGASEPNILVYSPSNQAWFNIAWLGTTPSETQLATTGPAPNDLNQLVTLGEFANAIAANPLAVASNIFTVIY